jgi:hypothetical protein
MSGNHPRKGYGCPATAAYAPELPLRPQADLIAPDLAEIDRQRQPFASLIRSNPPADVEPRATAERAWNPET